MGAHILPLSPLMAETAAALHAQSGFMPPWTASAFADLLSMPGGAGRLAMAAEEPVGLTLWRIAADEAEILTLCVLPERRRQGVGMHLLATAWAAMTAAGVRRLFLEAAVDNAAAHALYRGFGFRKEGRRPAYYQTPSGAVDATIYVKYYSE